jgi:flagellar basal body rod protein FlgG
MFLNSGLTLALDRIAERAADVRRAYTPGAVPRYDDVSTPSSSSTFTLDPLAVGAPADAYFVTADERGRRAYTRDGSFALRAGRLVDAGGHAIFGMPSRNGALSELRIDPVDEALGRAGNAAIEPDGSFVYRREAVDPRSGARESQRVVVGRIALARFPAGTRLETSDGRLAAPPDGVETQIGLAGDGAFSALAPMQRERSRVDLDESLARLKEAYLAFDALQAAEAAKAHLGKAAMDLLK